MKMDCREASISDNTEDIEGIGDFKETKAVSRTTGFLSPHKTVLKVSRRTNSWPPSGFEGGCLRIPSQNEIQDDKGVLFFVGSEEMIQVLEAISRVADTDVTILIHGESGVGKELVARAIHHSSMRKEKPFVKVNCAALPENLLESELFGYEKGAFTGAHSRKPGRFELAHGGTIFLDEISEISPSLQAKLLWVLQDREFSRLGGNRDIRVDARVLVATNRNLAEYVRTGHFREDLYYRLNVVSIHVPPLRERKEEIPRLFEYFLQKYSHDYGKRAVTLSEKASELLMRHDWPGNIRELQNIAKRLVVLGNEEVLNRALSQARPTEPHRSLEMEIERSATQEPKAISLKEISRKAAIQAERELIRKTLKQTRWHRKTAARLLGISYKALLYKIKDFDLDREPETSDLGNSASFGS